MDQLDFTMQCKLQIKINLTTTSLSPPKKEYIEYGSRVCTQTQTQNKNQFENQIKKKSNFKSLKFLTPKKKKVTTRAT